LKDALALLARPAVRVDYLLHMGVSKKQTDETDKGPGAATNSNYIKCQWSVLVRLLGCFYTADPLTL
jgi:hypothetical protein